MNKADGTHFWAQLSSIALRDYRLGEAQPSASVSMYRIVVTDNTEARRADEALKEFSFKLESAMVAANMAWWEMDVETGAVVFSKRKAELLSFPPDRFRNYQDFMALVHPDDVEPTMEAMRRYYAGSAAHYECEYRIATRTGEYKWFRDVGDAVTKDDHGKPLKLVGIALDITDRKRAETIMAIRLRLHRFASSHSLVELLRATLDEAEAVTGSTIGFYHFVEPTRRHYPSRRGRRIR
jgi:PAS domain S-box-containing protein